MSSKRNLGLVLSRLTASGVFFLDDDIRDLSADMLGRASDSLRRHGIAGYMVTGFPDNSVVRHAHRLAGGKQGVFLSGGSLAVADSISTLAFFPKIYNEDWLFMHDAVQNREAVMLGEARQLPYMPFHESKRATREEFGDVLAEGLYYLLAADSSIHGAAEEYWRVTLSSRKRLIADIVKHLTAQPGSETVERALLSLGAARAQLDTFSPHDFVSYVRAWRDDVDRWQTRLHKMPQDLTLGEAIDFLSLSAM